MRENPATTEQGWKTWQQLIQQNEPGNARIERISEMFVKAARMNYEEGLEKFAINRDHYAESGRENLKPKSKVHPILGQALGTNLIYNERQRRNLYEMLTKSRRGLHEPIERMPFLHYLDSQHKLEFSQAFFKVFLPAQPQPNSRIDQDVLSPNEEEKNMRSPLLYKPVGKSPL
jgi:hypothetical protein